MPEDGWILIVDDDEQMRSLLQKVLVRQGYQVAPAGSGEEALQRLAAQPFDLLLTDIRMPGMDGMALLGQVRQVAPETTVIMMTAFGTVGSAVEAMKQGAYHYISKPFKMDEVLIVLSRALEEKRLRRELVSMRQALAARYAFGNLIGRSRRMQEVFDLIQRVAPTPATVLISGRSGTGKELVARAIHYNSPRRAGAFVPVNCGAIPGELLESELFGYVKGAFTGAMADKSGLFVEADGGTIFLDEVAELGTDLQVKLLRVLQEREVRPVGSTRQLPVDVRVIAATNQALEGRIKAGLFREDLYYRLKVIPLALPDLRERVEDIPLLAEHFLRKHAGEIGPVRRLGQEAMAALVRYPWPGNVRELENAIERATVLCREEEIGVEDLPPELCSPAGMALRRALQAGATLEELEKDYILLVLERTGGHQTKAAEILGIDRRTLYRKLRAYGIQEPAPPAGDTS